MIDLIIPTFKNKEGLRHTLMSINQFLLSDITVVVIDDKSDINYNDIINDFPFVHIYYNQTNSGPGIARQYGISLTNNPYIMFIDTGDYFISNQVQENILQIIKDNSDIVVFSWQHKIGDTISENTNNRLHGRVYKREFLNNYNIKFCETTSFANEDIGFNRLCRLIIKDKQLKVLNFKEPIIVYDKNENSITNQNNGEFFYRQQNKALALSIIDVIKTAEQNNVSSDLILEEINSIMASLYYTFIRTKYERPEFIQDAWTGAKYFYDNCFSKYNNSPELVVGAYNIYVKRIYSRARYWKNFKPLNLNRFLQDLKIYSQIPSWYTI